MTSRERCPDPVHYDVLTDYCEVASISPDWDALLERSHCSRAFSCSKWFLATADLLPALQPLVLVAWRGRDLAGVLPLAVDANGNKAGFPDDWSSYCDMIVEHEDIDVAAGLLNLAFSGTGQYEKLILNRIRFDSNCLRAAQVLEADRLAEQLFVRGKPEMYAYVDLRRGYEEYIRTRTSNFRHNLNRIRNKARRAGVVARELKPGDVGPEQLMEGFLSVHLGRLGERSVLKGFRLTGSYLHNLFPSLFAEERMRVFALFKAQSIVGMMLCMVGNCSLFGWNGGFLPEVSALSPGSLVLDEVIRQACIEGLNEYDLGENDYQYKARWSTDLLEVTSLRSSAARNSLHLKMDPKPVA
jgi:CelD/BcsL family acetyltransferase involved in cellulose biosynthesis